MILNFVTGGSGHGKTRWLYEYLIRQAGENPASSYILVVPEQFTVQAGKELIDLHPDKGLLNIDVVSFRRLAARVLRETGRAGSRILTETGKSLLIRRAAGEIREDLPLLGHYLDRQGYIQELKSVFSEFAEYEITENQIRGMMEGMPGKGLLHEKLRDILKLRDAVDRQKKKLQEDAGDGREVLIPEELLGVFASCVQESQILRDCTLAFDGFTGFTPTQMTALRAMMGCCREMLVTVTIDAQTDPFSRIEEFELFAMSKRMIQDLRDMAEKMHAGPVRFFKMENGVRFRPGSMLETMEQRLMRYGRASGGSSGDIAPGDISLHVSGGPEEEAQFAARTIIDLVMGQGYQFSQIAVIAGDLPSYEHHIERVFSACQLPFFIDQKQAPVLDPCLEFVRAAMEVVTRRFSYEAVMRLLRTYLAGMDRETTDRMDLYLKAVPVRSRKRWEQEWSRTVRSADQEQLRMLNRHREALMEKLGPFLDAFSGKARTIKEYTEATEQLLVSFDIEAQMEALALALKDHKGHPMLMSAPEREARAEEYQGIFAEIMKVLEEMKDLIGQERVSVREFEQILETGLDEIRIGKVPPVLEQVYVGDMLRTRLSGIRALIMVGLNDGWIPARKEKNGILSEMDREYLKDLGVNLAPGMKEDAYIQRFYLYRALTKPSDRLYLSCLRNCGGTPMRPSYLMKEITGLFPGLETHDEDVIGREPENLILPGPGLEQIARGMRLSVVKQEAGPKLLELLGYARSRNLREQIRRLEQGAYFRLGEEALTEETAGELYGRVLEGSVTRMDQYALCPFVQFASYGLGLKEREEGKIRPVDAGTLYHDVLERFSRTVTESPEYDWFTLTEEQEEKILQESISLAVQGEKQELFEDTQRNRFVVERTTENLRSAVRAMVCQVQAGEFVPEQFELPFRATISPDPSLAVELVGKIDRLDLYTEGDTVYVKVIDYKSGSTRFDLPLIYDGRQLQLLAYLGQARRLLKEETGKEIIAAGIFYMHLMDPAPVGIQPEKELSVEEIDRKLFDQLRPDGLINSDPHALELYARDEDLRRHVVPVPRYNRDGEILKTSPSATEKQMEALERMCEERIRSFAEQISRGVIRPVPYKEAGKTACEYCRFREACFFDGKLPGAVYRDKSRLARQEVLEKIMREEDETDGTDS